MDSKQRTIKELWAQHMAALAAKDIDSFVLDFADDCLFINNPKGGHAGGIYRGQEGVRAWCREFFPLFERMTDFVAEPASLIDNVAMVLWEIESPKSIVRNGVDTFVVKDGLFQIVTVVYDVRKFTSSAE